MPIAFLHTALKIVLRGVSHLICAALDLFVGVNIRLWPAPSLVKARQYKDQPDLRITLPQAEDRLRCQSIKPQGTACAEVAISLLNQRNQGILKRLEISGRSSVGNSRCPVKQTVFERINFALLSNTINAEI